ncbi:putative transposase [Fistulifera solaris]|uniref:Putative transposase n=1 Tax=Fistulifera solaris TaxID=1519565 RepID=A0A1Z5K9B8_FISSO|nr:putative transposase [Fistulifera solaris]|eukprot:GAX22752.1 putative transposase [Fistulifera solaris]
MAVLSTMKRSKDEIVALEKAKAALGVPPPIDFYTFETKRERNGEKTDSEMERDEYRTFEVNLSNAEGRDDKYEVKIRIFRFGKPEEWCTLCENVKSLAQKKAPPLPPNATDAQVQTERATTETEIFSATLEGKASAIFEQSLRKYIDKEPKERLRWALNEVAITVFSSPDDAHKIQKRYLQKGHLRMFGHKPQYFWRRLETLNNWLPFFPSKRLGNGQLARNNKLPDDILIDILDEARHGEVQQLMMAQRATSDRFETADAYANDLDGWWDAWQCKKALEQKAEENKRKEAEGKRKRDDSTETASNRKNKKQRKACRHCKKYHKAPDEECRSLLRNSNNGGAQFLLGQNNNKKNDKFNKAVNKKALEMTTNALKKLKEHRNNKRRVVEDESDDEMDAYAVKLLQSMQGKDNEVKNSHYTAEIIVQIENKDGELVPARCLLDTGTTESIVLRDFVRRGRAKSYKGKTTKWKTMGGTFETNQKALIDFSFPELSGDKRVTWICHVDRHTKPDKAMYDMILGMDLLTAIGLVVDTENRVVRWEQSTTPLKQRGMLNESNMLQILYHASPGISTVHEAENRQARILDADYSKVDIEEYVKELDYLTQEEKHRLTQVLIRCELLFGGGLGTLNIPPVHLELQEGATPYHSRAFPIPQSLYETTKKEINRLTEIDVFEKNHESEWAAPTFVQPKKTGDVRILTDFRRLNEALKRKPFPLPRIAELLQRLQGFKFATAIDLSMGYYHIPLDEESQKLCTTILPWGKYRYKRLPMGIKNCPDIFQSIMSDLLGDLDFAMTYIDDILITSNGTFEDHMEKLSIVLNRLQKAGFRANVRKCFFAKSELEYLGYVITREGMQPQPKKVEAIMRIKEPTTKRQLRHFLGMINYYRDMWRRRSHLMAPLTQLVSDKVKFHWGPEQQEAFDEIKRNISRETMLSFPDFNKPFHIHTDASAYQLGAVISQDDKPLAFYSRKMNKAQQRYTTGEQELLSIVETLKEFRSLLLGQRLIVHTDHMNIIHGKLSNDRITRWRLLLEEYGPEYVHIAGKDNVVADALSRLNCTETVPETVSTGQYAAYVMAHAVRDESTLVTDDPNWIAATFASSTEAELEQFPMHPSLIAKYQTKDTKLQQKVVSDPNFSRSTIEDTELIMHKNRIVIPTPLRQRIVAWYHLYLRHPGQTRMEGTLSQLYWWPNMRHTIEQHVKTCRECQLCKKTRKKYGHLPPKEAEPAIPWQRVNVDLIGPLNVQTPNGSFELNALTMIDPTTGWFEIAEVHDRTADTVSEAFDHNWLSRYPRPQFIGFDNGGENKGVFKKMTDNYGLTRKPSTTHNPQSNGIIERVHAVLSDMLRTFELEERELDPIHTWKDFLSSVAFAIRATYHTTLEATPAQLVFGRDMILPITFRANWEALRQRRQQTIDKNNQRENASRIPHEYQVGDKVLYKKHGILCKLSTPRHGPYEVTQRYANGTIRIRRGPVTERVNIRLVQPYFESEDVN